MVTVLQPSVEERCVDLYRRCHQVAFAPDKRVLTAIYAPPVLRSLGTGQRLVLYLDGNVSGYQYYCGQHQLYVDNSVVMIALFRGGAQPGLSPQEVAALYEFQMHVVFGRPEVARLPFGENARQVTRTLGGLDFVGMPLGRNPYDCRWVEIILKQDPYAVRSVILGPEEFLHMQLRRPDWGGMLAYLHITFVRPDLAPSRLGSEVGQD